VLLSVKNEVVADAYSEKLNARLGEASGDVVKGMGSVTLLGAQQVDASALSVGLSGTGVAGLKSGTVRVEYETDGSGTSGLSALGVGGETVSVSGKVYRLAVGSVHASVTLAAVREGGVFAPVALSRMIWEQVWWGLAE